MSYPPTPTTLFPRIKIVFCHCPWGPRLFFPRFFASQRPKFPLFSLRDSLFSLENTSSDRALWRGLGFSSELDSCEGKTWYIVLQPFSLYFRQYKTQIRWTFPWEDFFSSVRYNSIVRFSEGSLVRSEENREILACFWWSRDAITNCLKGVRSIFWLILS